ncbi:MAG: phytanoyl-CoA dioxygenase family protein [Pseudomonadota bacterium]
MLTPDELHSFYDTGWILREGLFDAAELERMRTCFDGLERTARGLRETGLCDGAWFVLGTRDREQVIKRVVWAGAAQRYLLDVSADPRLTVPAAQLLGSRTLEQLLCQAHFKRPHDGVTFDWHQDIQHRDKGGDTWRDVNGRGSYVQTLIALDEMTPDSGPLKFVRGSARWGRVAFSDGGYDHPDGEAQKPPQFRDEDVVTIDAKPGDTLFFGPYAAHASFANTSPAYRRVLINGYAYPGANGRVYPGDGAGRCLHVDTPDAIADSAGQPREL